LPVTAALVLVVDQISKYLVRTWLIEGQSWDLAPWLAPIVRVTYVTNTGVAFGLFQNLGNFFIIVPIVVIGLILFFHHQLPDGQRLMRLVLGLALGGATGNLIDRLRFGSVVDFIDCNFWPLREWPVFNLADTSIVTGVALLVLMLVWEERRERYKQQAAEGG
jgi:signal peptidase II